jgi:hypothetical protein
MPTLMQSATGGFFIDLKCPERRSKQRLVTRQCSRGRAATLDVAQLEASKPQLEMSDRFRAADHSAFPAR